MVCACRGRSRSWALRCGRRLGVYCKELVRSILTGPGIIPHPSGPDLGEDRTICACSHKPFPLFYSPWGGISADRRKSRNQIDTLISAAVNAVTRRPNPVALMTKSVICWRCWEMGKVRAIIRATWFPPLQSCTRAEYKFRFFLKPNSRSASMFRADNSAQR